MKIAAFLAMITMALMSGCADHDEQSGRPVQGLWGNEKISLEMSFSETVRDPLTGTGIRFSDVTDSRCPQDITCLLPGKVQAHLDIIRNEKVISSFTISSGEQIESFVNQQSFIFTFSAVTPDTRSTEGRKENYTITLEVEPE
ncbi:hypothetical protein KK083_02565 [Fulvivirgaceae bacterium PWU4]|uniref:Uncharacterized protein n=1 Tax=Chryseosolibacter histidini TaxID=2782349 RepID=A0AAP2DI00_9BACT|nr:hypothetical protein [Chryseosolibacter histidini]MBT1695743.1 hypothetical protein [Chryseosolibacter histidini]